MSRIKASFRASVLLCSLTSVAGHSGTVAAINGIEEGAKAVGKAIAAAYETLDKERANPQQASEAERQAAFRRAAADISQWIDTYLEKGDAYRKSNALTLRYIRALFQLGIYHEYSGELDQAFEVYKKAKTVPLFDQSKVAKSVNSGLERIKKYRATGNKKVLEEVLVFRIQSTPGANVTITPSADGSIRAEIISPDGTITLIEVVDGLYTLTTSSGGVYDPQRKGLGIADLKSDLKASTEMLEQLAKPSADEEKQGREILIP